MQGSSVSFFKIWDRLDIMAAGKRAFLAAPEAWNHLERVGITQMNKLWVGILILGKHLSPERERERAASCRWIILSFCPDPHCFIKQPASFSSPICFHPFGLCLHFVSIWYSFIMCFHISVSTWYTIHLIRATEKKLQGKPLRPYSPLWKYFCFVGVVVILRA